MDVLVNDFALYVERLPRHAAASACSRPIGALVLGMLLAAFRVSPVPPLRWFGTAYVTVFRNSPLTVVFFFFAFALPWPGSVPDLAERFFCPASSR